MADIHIRNVDDEHYKKLKRQAVDEEVTLKELMMRMLGFPRDGEAVPDSPSVNSAPARLGLSARPAHQAGCKCMMCQPNR